MTKAQTIIEKIYQHLMDIRDSTPLRRGHIAAEMRFTRVYVRAYKTSRLKEFYGAAEKYRHFLQDMSPEAKKETK